MKKHFWQQILVPLVLVFAILICGTSNVLGKYAGTNGPHLLASVEFGDTKTPDADIVVLNKGEEPTDEKIFVYPDGDPSTSIWGAGDPNADSYMTYGWNNAEELIFTVENRTDSPVKIEVEIRMALPVRLEGAGDPVPFTMPYTLREVCPTAETSAGTDENLISENDPTNSYYHFQQIGASIGGAEYRIWGIGGWLWCNYVEFKVTIPTELVLIKDHIHTYQFNFGIPTAGEGAFYDGDLEELLSYASYMSIQIKAVSQ